MSVTQTLDSTKTTLRFDISPNVERSLVATMKSLEKFIDLCISEFSCGFEAESNDVLYFFPLKYLIGFDPSYIDQFFSDLKNNWNAAAFEIVEETNGTGHEFFNVGFPNKTFRLKSIS